MLLNNYTHHQETILKWLMALGQDITFLIIVSLEIRLQIEWAKRKKKYVPFLPATYWPFCSYKINSHSLTRPAVLITPCHTFLKKIYAHLIWYSWVLICSTRFNAHAAVLFDILTINNFALILIIHRKISVAQAEAHFWCKENW